jgi:hypothetical protein
MSYRPGIDYQPRGHPATAIASITLGLRDILISRDMSNSGGSQ